MLIKSLALLGAGLLVLISSPNSAFSYEYCTTAACNQACKNNITVDTTLDGSAVGGSSYCSAGVPCNIRKAIHAAGCNVGGPSTIYIPAGSYTINSAGYELNTSGSYWPGGDLDLRRSATVGGLRIVGAGDSTIIDGGALGRILEIHPDSYITIENLKIVNGAHTAGANSTRGKYVPEVNDGGSAIRISATATVIINNVTFENNRISALGDRLHQACGGAIYNEGSLYLNNVRFIGNAADRSGGAVCNNGYLSVRNSSLSGNRANATNVGGGGAIYSGPGKSVVIDNTMLISNNAYQGGAIYLDGIQGQASGFSSVSRAILKNNSSLFRGGAIATTFSVLGVDQSEFLSNVAKGAGGGVHFDKVLAGYRNTVSKSVFQYNRAGNGGAIHSEGLLKVSRSLLQYNRSEYLGVPVYSGHGGAIASWAPLEVEGSSIGNNIANASSGAIFAPYEVKLINTTVFENMALETASAISALSRVELKNSTFVNNRSFAAYDIPQLLVNTSGTLTMAYNVFRSELSNTSYSFKVFGYLTSRGYNISNGKIGLDRAPLSSSVDAAKDRTEAEAYLSGPILGNEPIGAPSSARRLIVYRPMAYSPAKDIGETYVNYTDNVIAAGCTKVDGAGFARPLTGYCDAGASEYVYVPTYYFSTSYSTSTATLSR